MMEMWCGTCNLPTHMQSEERWAFSPNQIAHLIRIWGRISDTDGTISHRQLVKVVRSLLPPLGMGPDATNVEIVNAVERMGVVPVFQQRCGPKLLRCYVCRNLCV